MSTRLKLGQVWKDGLGMRLTVDEYREGVAEYSWWLRPLEGARRTYTDDGKYLSGGVSVLDLIELVEDLPHSQAISVDVSGKSTAWLSLRDEVKRAAAEKAAAFAAYGGAENANPPMTWADLVKTPREIERVLIDEWTPMIASTMVTVEDVKRGQAVVNVSAKVVAPVQQVDISITVEGAPHMGVKPSEALKDISIEPAEQPSTDPRFGPLAKAMDVVDRNWHAIAHFNPYALRKMS